MQKEARFREYGFMDLTFLKITSAGLRNVCMCVCFVTQSCPTLVTPWTIAHQAPLSMEIILARILEWVALLQEMFPTQGLHPGLPHCGQILYFLNPRDTQEYGVGSLSLLQGNCLTQKLNCGLLNCRWIFTS